MYVGNHWDMQREHVTNLGSFRGMDREEEFKAVERRIVGVHLKCQVPTRIE